MTLPGLKLHDNLEFMSTSLDFLFRSSSVLLLLLSLLRLLFSELQNKTEKH